MKKLPLSEVYHWIEAGPVVLLTTADKGRPNVMAMSWHMMLEFEPPLIACVVSNGDYSYTALRKTKECVIAVPSSKLARKVVNVGNCSGENLNKFKKFGLTPKPAAQVKAPLVDECFINMECKVIDTSMVNKYCLFILEVVEAWIDPEQKNPRIIHHHGYGKFAIDGKMIRLKSRMQ